jgi:3D (Asp-Asp-Asp) domain-containing protein
MAAMGETRMRTVAALLAALLILAGGTSYDQKDTTPPRQAVLYPASERLQPASDDSRADRGESRIATEASLPINEQRHSYDRSPEGVDHAAVSRDPGLPGRGGISRRLLGTFKLTAYSLAYADCGKHPHDPAYGITASGTYVKEGRTVAADWEVLPPGSIIYIEDLGLRLVEDRGGAVIGNHLDIFIPDERATVIFGVQHKKVWLIERGTK